MAAREEGRRRGGGEFRWAAMPRDCYSEFLVPNLSAVLAVRDSLVSPADGVPQPALMAGSVAGVDPWWRVSATPSTSHGAATNRPCRLAMRQCTALLRPGQELHNHSQN